MEHLPPPYQELEHARPANLAGLVEGRHAQTERAADMQVRDILRSIDRSSGRETTIMKVQGHGFAMDSGILTPAELLSFEAVGIEPAQLLAQTGPNGVVSGEEIAQLTYKNETLRVSSFGSGVSIRLEITGDLKEVNPHNKARHMRQLVTSRFMASPGHSVIAKIHHAYAEKELPDRIITEPFSLEKDPLGSVALLVDLGLARPEAVSQYLRKEYNPGAIARRILDEAPITKRRQNDAVVYEWGKGVEQKLYIHSQSSMAMLQFTKKPEQYHSEKTHGSLSEAVPFIETTCAKELCSWLDKHGLMFSPEIQRRIMAVGNSEARLNRSGSVYAAMSSRLAIWLSKEEDDRLLHLFMPYDEDYGPRTYARVPSKIDRYIPPMFDSAEEEAQAIQYVKQALKETDTDQFGEAAGTLLSLAKQISERSNQFGELPVTANSIQISHGACNDVATYYTGAAGMEPPLKKLYQREINGVPMLEKTYNVNTFLLVRPTRFNGITLPKGSLMSRSPVDGGWLFQRLTPFTFDCEEDQLATGSELPKAYEIQAESIRQIGGVTLNHLIQAASKSR